MLFLTARDALPTGSPASSAGGDDYLTKPFALRRARGAAAGAAATRRRRRGRRGSAGCASTPRARRSPAARRSTCRSRPPSSGCLLGCSAAPGEAVRRHDLVRAGLAPRRDRPRQHARRVRRAACAASCRGLPGAPEIATVHGVGYSRPMTRVPSAASASAAAALPWSPRSPSRSSLDDRRLQRDPRRGASPSDADAVVRTRVGDRGCALLRRGRRTARASARRRTPARSTARSGSSRSGRDARGAPRQRGAVDRGRASRSRAGAGQLASTSRAADTRLYADAGRRRRPPSRHGRRRRLARALRADAADRAARLARPRRACSCSSSRSSPRWLLAASLRPVSRMTRQAEAWSERDLDRRFARRRALRRAQPSSRPRSTALLDRLSASLRREQRFSAEISHELRTPLARVIAEAELALAARAPRRRVPERPSSAVHRQRPAAGPHRRRARHGAPRYEADTGRGTAECVRRRASRRSRPSPGSPPNRHVCRSRREPPHCPVAARHGRRSGASGSFSPSSRTRAHYSRGRVRVALSATRARMSCYTIDDDGPGVMPGETRVASSSRGCAAPLAAASSGSGGAGLGLALARGLWRGPPPATSMHSRARTAAASSSPSRGSDL